MKKTFVVAITAVVLLGGVVACQDTQQAEEAVPTPDARITIMSPSASAELTAGQTVSVEASASDGLGVGRVELWVDEDLVDTAAPQQEGGVTMFDAVLFWVPESMGNFEIEVKGYSGSGEVRTSATQLVSVTDQVVIRPTATLPPARSSTGGSRPGQSSASGGRASIRYFRADVTQADVGDTITLEWDVSGADMAYLYHSGPDGKFGLPAEVGATGTQEHTVEASEQGYVRFTLSVPVVGGQRMSETFTVALGGSTAERAEGDGCAHAWFFLNGPSECASGRAVVSSGAQQHFERGVMIWVQMQDSIYILFDGDGDTERRWEALPDRFEDGMPERDETIHPPHNLHQPERGFGLAWRTTPGLRDRIGWAIDDEVGAETAVQAMAVDGGEVTFLKNLYSGVYRLEPDGTWSFIPEPGEEAQEVVTEAPPDTG